MKTKSILKYVVISVTAITVLLSLFLFFITKRFNPEIFISELEKSVMLSLPNTQIKSKSVDFKFGLNSKIIVKDIDLLLKGPKVVPLINVQEMVIQVPLSYVIFQTGKIDIKSHVVKLDVIDIKNKSNLLWAFESDKKPLKEKVLATNYFEEAEVNVLFDQIEVSLHDSNNVRKYNLNKIIFKDLLSQHSSAFEVVGNLEFIKNNEKSKFDLLLIGETVINDFFTKNLLEIKAKLNITNLESTYLNKKIEKLHFDIQTSISRDFSYKLFASSFYDEKNIGSFEVADSEASGFVLNDMNLKIPVSDLNIFLNEKIYSKIKSLDNENLEIVGNVDYKNFSNSNLDFKISNKINLNILGNEVDGNLGGQLKNNKFNVYFANDGENLIKFNYSFSVDRNLSGSGFQFKLSSAVLDFEAKNYSFLSGFNLENFRLQNSQNNSTYISWLLPIFEYLKFNYNLSNVGINNTNVSGLINCSFGQKNKCQAQGFSIEKSVVDFSLVNQINSNLENETSLDLNAKLLNLADLTKIVEMKFKLPNLGMMSGSFKADWTELMFNAEVNASFTDGVFTLFDLNQINAEYFKLNAIVNDNPAIITENFKTLQIKASFENQKIRFNQLLLTSADQSYTINGKGVWSESLESNLSLKLKFLNKEAYSYLYKGSPSSPVVTFKKDSK